MRALNLTLWEQSTTAGASIPNKTVLETIYKFTDQNGIIIRSFKKDEIVIPKEILESDLIEELDGKYFLSKSSIIYKCTLLLIKQGVLEVNTQPGFVTSKQKIRDNIHTFKLFNDIPLLQQTENELRATAVIHTFKNNLWYRDETKFVKEFLEVVNELKDSKKEKM